MPRRRKYSDILRFPQTYNGVEASEDQILSRKSSKPLPASDLPTTDEIPAQQVEEQTTQASSPTQVHSKEPTVLRQLVRSFSLTPPPLPKRAKTDPIPNKIRSRASSVSFSAIKSFISSKMSRRKNRSQLSLLDVPVEITENIIQRLPQSGQRAMLLTHTSFVDMAAAYLYMAPHFASTYRYAQFAHIVSHKPCYADLVRDLDVSCFSDENLDGEGEFLPSAGWREFKYRENEDYYFSLLKPRRRGSNHPAPSTSLKSYAKVRDIPIGGITHVIAACKNLRKIDLSNLQLASDFLISSPYDTSFSRATEHAVYKATATSGLQFVSDVPRSWDWSSSNMQPLYFDFIISHLVQLEYLESFIARGSLWVTQSRVQRLLGMLEGERGCQVLKYVDFRDSGVCGTDACWCHEGTVEQMKECVRRPCGRHHA